MPYRISNQHATHFVTCTVVEWVDVFSRRRYKDMLVESLDFCRLNKGLRINAYVIMSNHIHLVIGAKEPNKLSDIIRDFKKFTSKRIVNDIRNNNKESRRQWMFKIFEDHGLKNKSNTFFQLWQNSNMPIEVYSPKWVSRRVNYIHNNPVKAGLVWRPEDYIYSSASNYVNGNGILNCEVFDLGFDNGYIHF